MQIKQDAQLENIQHNLKKISTCRKHRDAQCLA